MSGERVRDFRRVYGLTQEQMATTLGISRAQVANYETERSSPPPYIWLALKEIARRFDEWDDYIGRQDVRRDFDARYVARTSGISDDLQGRFGSPNINAL